MTKTDEDGDEVIIEDKHGRDQLTRLDTEPRVETPQAREKPPTPEPLDARARPRIDTPATPALVDPLVNDPLWSEPF